MFAAEYMVCGMWVCFTYGAEGRGGVFRRPSDEN